MPVYVYKCPVCEIVKEVTHSMSDVDDPSEEVQRMTSCNEATCPAIREGSGVETEGGITLGTKWNRVPQVFGMDGDKLANNKSKRDKFQKERRKRAVKHFQSDVLPGLGSDEQKHFKKKYGYKS